MKTDNAGIIFSVGGGKGGVGKSIFSIALGVSLAKNGYSVILIDLDLGAANLHTYMNILGKTPAISDFIFKKVSSLEDVLIKTSQKNLMFISGADFVPGMANPAYWTKLKIMRHIRALPSEYIIIDLGAGVHFNVLDFFAISHKGIVITVPEPGAVMNAYSFVKGALFRTLQNVFRNHPNIGPVIESESKRSENEDVFTLEWLSEKVKCLAPDVLPLVEEIGNTFCPSLVVNRISGSQTHILVDNFLSLCRRKLGVEMEYIGNVPESKEITYYLLNVPKFLNLPEGKTFYSSIQKIAERLTRTSKIDLQKENISFYSDEEIEEVIRFIDSLDDKYFVGTNKNIWKLRMFFKPSQVSDFLLNQGLNHESFYKFLSKNN
ncbi:MAG: nucleotide-binding protein [Thermodesulfovibrionales bacterium]